MKGACRLAGSFSGRIGNFNICPGVSVCRHLLLQKAFCSLGEPILIFKLYIKLFAAWAMQRS